MDGVVASVRPSMSFEIEKILGITCEGNLVNYRIQWAPVWVTASHLVGCEQMIEEFKQQQRLKLQQQIKQDEEQMQRQKHLQLLQKELQQRQHQQQKQRLQQQHLQKQKQI